MSLLDPKELPATTAGLINELTDVNLTYITTCFEDEKDKKKFKNANSDAIYYFIPAAEDVTEKITQHYRFLYNHVGSNYVFGIIYNKIDNTQDTENFCGKFNKLKDSTKQWTIIEKEEYEKYYREENPE